MYNIGCNNHLYFIEKKENKYIAKCLYCGKMQYFNSYEEMGTIPLNAVFQDMIFEKHHINCDYTMINKFIMDLVINNPSLTNYEVLMHLQIHLYTMTLTNYFQKFNDNKNLFNLMYYRKKIKAASEELKEIKKRQQDYKHRKIIRKYY